MASLALGMFILLFAFGAKVIGWHDPQGPVQIGLVMSFLLGAVFGHRNR